MTPEERARKSARAMWERDQASQALGMKIERIAPGEAVLSFTVAPKHLNGHGICHGGFIYALADSAFAFACNSYNRVVVAQQNQITYLSPAREGERLEEVFAGCANQAGEDNRNVARMSALLAGLPETVPGTTINRLCGSGMDAIGTAARAIMAGEMDVALAGGVESMSRAPFVQPKADSAFSRRAEIFDTTIGWRFVNPLMERQYGIDSMPETAENVAEEFSIARADQDAFALRSQQRAAAAIASGRLAEEIAPVSIPRRKGEPVIVAEPARALSRRRQRDGGQCLGGERRRGCGDRSLRGGGQ